MSRVIKFRAWDKERKQMVRPHDGDFIKWHAPCNWKEFYEVMQFTGLTDCNGVEIYEGDIVKWDDASKGRYWRFAIVEWHPEGCWTFKIVPHKCVGCFGMGGEHHFKMGSFIYTPDTGKYGNAMKVLGNIYEHPHLLETVK